MEDDDGNLWISTADGLTKTLRDPDDFTASITVTQELCRITTSGAYTKTIVSEVWAITAGGLARYRQDQFSFLIRRSKDCSSNNHQRRHRWAERYVVGGDRQRTGSD